MLYQNETIETLLLSNTPIETAKDIISKYLINGVEIEVILKTPDVVGQKDIIKLKPISAFEVSFELSAILAKYAVNSWGNINEILFGGGKFFLAHALRDFLTKQTKDHTCEFIEYNGVPMHINEIAANIFNKNSEYENQNFIFQEIVDFFAWNYCFFLDSNATVTAYIADCNEILRQLNSYKQLTAERDLINKAIKTAVEVEEQVQKNLNQVEPKLNTEKKSKKPLKPKHTGSNV